MTVIYMMTVDDESSGPGVVGIDGTVLCESEPVCFAVRSSPDPRVGD